MPPQPSGMSRWLGPIAGLAAGLGLAALLSHFGMGEGVANFLMIALLVMAAVFVFRLLLRQESAVAARPPLAAPPAIAADAFRADDRPVARQRQLRADVPAGFDTEGFLRQAKLNFIRLQAANDAGNLDDLKQFLAPEVFAEIQMQYEERGQAKQETDVQHLDAQLLEVVTEGNRTSPACASPASSARKPAPPRSVRRNLAPGQAGLRRARLAGRRHPADPVIDEAPVLGALNHLLGQAAWARRQACALRGPQARFDMPPWQLDVVVTEDGLFAADRAKARSTSPSRCRPKRPLLALQGIDRVMAAAHVTGNAEFATALSFVLRNLRWDAEEDLSTLVGDIAAHRSLAAVPPRLTSWQKRTPHATWPRTSPNTSARNPGCWCRRASLPSSAKNWQTSRNRIEKLEARAKTLA